MATTRSEGLASGIVAAARTGTVFLPMFFGAIFGLFTEPDRAIGTWLQSIWVFALLASLWHYFRVCLKSGPILALTLCLPFASLHAIYYFNGGLADFRMDLHLYLLFGCAVTWLYIGLQTGSASAWVICGLFIACGTLSRATAPVYLAFTFALILGAHLLAQGFRNFGSLSRGCLLAGVTAGLLSIWFYILNFQELYFYYVIWNPDANAHLPLAVSRQHITFAFESIGMEMLVAVLVSVSLLGWTAAKGTRLGSLFRIWRSSRLWKIAPAVAPLSFLVLRGAGLNPFVSMPGSFGILFFLLSLPGDLSRPPRWVKLVSGGLLLIASLASAWQGGRSFRPSLGMDSSILAYHGIIDAIVSDAKKHGCAKADVVGVTLSSNMSSLAVENVMIFDHGFSVLRETCAKDGFDLNFHKSKKFAPAAPVEWAKFGELPPADVIAKLAEEARTEVEYLVLPDDATVAHLAKNLSFNYINNYSGPFRDTLLQRGKWERISDGLRISEEENFHVYANRELVRSP